LSTGSGLHSIIRKAAPIPILEKGRATKKEAMTTDPKAESLSDARARLGAHFAEFHGEKYGDGWSALWDKGDFLPWDKGFPNPALVDLLDQRHALIGTAIVEGDGEQRRKKALVPGCGRGYDVLLLASRGYDAYGLEYSATAVKACEQEAKEHADKYPVKDPGLGRGSVQFVSGDFFKDDWFSKAGVEGKFDLIYDYTVL
jgi:methyl halide transferase